VLEDCDALQMTTVTECRYRRLGVVALNLPRDRVRMFEERDQAKLHGRGRALQPKVQARRFMTNRAGAA
jgi:hypothetical protein